MSLNYTDATTAPAASTASSSGAARLTRMTNWLMAPYLVAILVFMLGLKVTPSPDVVIVLLALGAVLMGRGIAFVRDWAPFLLTFLAWEMMRGIANQFGQAVHSDSVIAIERALFAGFIPTEVLQAAFYRAGTVSWYDIVLTLFYSSHFFFPLAFAFFLWLRRRERYYPFVAALMLTSFAAFATFLVLPVAPPRFAFQYGEALAVVDVARETGERLDWLGFNLAYRNLVGNPVAAVPSMHAAYPVLVALFLAERSRRAILAWLPFVGLIWLATVYLGHHYVIDLIAGALYAVVFYLIVRRFWRSREPSAATQEPNPADLMSVDHHR
jgi:membrane-associated phospholipid phosphatase